MEQNEQPVSPGAVCVARLIAIGVLLLAALVLAGRALDIAALKSVLPDWVSMKPNAALAFVLKGLALWRQRELLLLAAGVVAAGQRPSSTVGGRLA